MRAAGLAMIAIAALAAPVTAQDGSEAVARRTPESANRFLSQVFTREDSSRLWFTAYARDGALAEDGAAGASIGDVSADVTAVVSAEGCATRIAYRDAYLSAGNARLPDGDRLVEWRKVARIEKPNINSVKKVTDADGVVTSQTSTTYYGIKIVRNDGLEAAMLRTPIEDERERAVFAIEFLRGECSLKSDTGF